VTGSQAPLPPEAAGFHHLRVVPPFRLQSFTVIVAKELPEEAWTSKYSPVEEGIGVLTGFDEYCATVTAPTPVALTEVLSLVALAVPVELVDDPLAWLVDPAGAVGGAGEIEFGTIGVTGLDAAGVVNVSLVPSVVPFVLVATSRKS
jgi:hypothetical protein